MAERYVRAALAKTPLEELRALRAKALDQWDLESAALLDHLIAEREPEP